MNKKLLILLLLFLPIWPSSAWGNERYASIVVDAANGKVLQAVEAQERRHPASLTKIMTLYLTFKALRQGTLRINQSLPVSEYAASQPPSRLGLNPGTSLRVRDAIFGLVTQSANDAAVVLAEAMAGSEASFATQMTTQARQLGMQQTVFRNASGLPDDEQVTSARDMAILARAIYFNFPDYYRFFSTPRFEYLGRTHVNHNRLMLRYSGMDGIKTGYIRASGFNLVASAVRGKTRLIAVVFGGESARSRDNHMAALLDNAFEKISQSRPPTKAPPVAVQQLVSAPQPSEGNREITDEKEPPSRLALNEQKATQAPKLASPPSTPAGIKIQAPKATALTTTLKTDKPKSEAKNSKPQPEKVKAKPENTKATSEKTKAVSAGKNVPAWTVVRGDFPSHAAAKQQAGAIAKQLGGAKPLVIRVASRQSRNIFRLQFAGLSETAARQFCRRQSAKVYCQVSPAGR